MSNKVTMEIIDGEVHCEYGEQQKDNPTAIVCDLTQSEVENIMTIGHVDISKYLRDIYNREIKKALPPKYKVVGCSEKVLDKINKHATRN